MCGWGRFNTLGLEFRLKLPLSSRWMESWVNTVATQSIHHVPLAVAEAAAAATAAFEGRSGEESARGPRRNAAACCCPTRSTSTSTARSSNCGRGAGRGMTVQSKVEQQDGFWPLIDRLC
jgi:hypothetical protein